MNRVSVRFIPPPSVPAPETSASLSRYALGPYTNPLVATGQAATEANFFDALRAVTPTLIITGIAIGIASGLGSTIGTTLGTLIVSRFDRKQRHSGR